MDHTTPATGASDCGQCGTLLDIVKDLVTRLGSTKADLTAERELRAQLQYLNTHLIADASIASKTTIEARVLPRDSDARLISSTGDRPEPSSTTSGDNSVAVSSDAKLRDHGKGRELGNKAQEHQVSNKAPEDCAAMQARANDELETNLPMLSDRNSLGPDCLREPVQCLQAEPDITLVNTSIDHLSGRAIGRYREAIRMQVINMPGSHGLVTRRTVLLTGIPAGVTLHDVLLRVRGGQLVSATINDTVALIGSLSARLVFLDEASAVNFVRSTVDVPLLVSTSHASGAATSQVRARHIQAFTHPLDQYVAEAIYTNNATRVLRVADLGPQALDPVFLLRMLSRTGTKQHGVIHIDQWPPVDAVGVSRIRPTPSTWSRTTSPADRCVPPIMLYFDSVANALRAYERLTVHLHRHFLFRACRVGFVTDPCSGPGRSGQGDKPGVAGRDGDAQSARSRADSAIGEMEEGEVKEDWLIEL